MPDAVRAGRLAAAGTAAACIILACGCASRAPREAQRETARASGAAAGPASRFDEPSLEGPATRIWTIRNEMGVPVEFKLTLAEKSDFGTMYLSDAPRTRWLRLEPREQMPFEPSDGIASGTRLGDDRVHLIARCVGVRAAGEPVVARFAVEGTPPLNITMRDIATTQDIGPVMYAEVTSTSGWGVAHPIHRRYWPSDRGE